MAPMLKFAFPLIAAAVLSMAAEKKPVTPEIAAASAGREGVESLAWSPGGRQFVYREDGFLHRFDAASGKSKRLDRLSVLELQTTSEPKPKSFSWRNRRVAEAEFQWFPDGERLLVKAGGDLFIYPLDGQPWTQLTATPADEADPKVSPDGRYVSFRRGHDLYVAEAATKNVRRLTQDGSATLWNAELDWVYPEELDLETAHWWSPDSTHIAYLQFDVSREHLYPHADVIQLMPRAEPQRFPKAGTPNADVRLGVVSAGGGRTRWLDSVDGAAGIIGRVNWLPDSSALAVQKLNRIQNRLELLRVPLRGRPETILEETDEHWVNLSKDLTFLVDSPRFLWSSERDGYRHLFLYSLDGEVERRLTSGDWETTGVACVDEKAGLVYYASTELSPLERHLYAAGFDGGERKRLTAEPGVHSVDMGPACEYYVDTHSSMERPTRKTVHRADGSATGVLEPPDENALRDVELLPSEIVTLRASGGALLYGRVMKPAGFQEGIQYPAVVFVYGGPHSQTIRNSWAGAGLRQVMAHAGFVVWQLDSRGSAGRGHEWETKVYRQFGKQELADQLEGVDHLISMGFVDPKRVGVYGWSYGGFMTLYSMLHSPAAFRAGVAGAPVTDWRNYDTIYTERYMGIPAENEEAYRNSSPVHFAENLKGDLLLIHNIEDDNVLFQNTMQMSAKLQQAGRPFEMMVYSQKAHGVTGKERAHLYRTILDFFERRLK